MGLVTSLPRCGNRHDAPRSRSLPRIEEQRGGIARCRAAGGYGSQAADWMVLPLKLIERAARLVPLSEITPVAWLRVAQMTLSWTL
jgi:hypothetical protein